jgi:hypothetical protein
LTLKKVEITYNLRWREYKIIYIKNPGLFLNYPIYFYILFLSCIFISESLSYFYFPPRPSTFRFGDGYVCTCTRLGRVVSCVQKNCRTQHSSSSGGGGQ